MSDRQDNAEWIALQLRAEKAERERDETRGALADCSSALVLASGILMRPVAGTPDEELLAARIAVLHAQDRATRAAVKAEGGWDE